MAQESDEARCCICIDGFTAEKPQLTPAPCKCKGSIAYHRDCLQYIVDGDIEAKCGICKEPYNLFQYLSADEKRCILEASPLHIRFLSPEEQTSELCIIAIRKDPSVFKYIHSSVQSDDIVRLAIELDPSNIEHITNESRECIEICKAAISHNDNKIFAKMSEVMRNNEEVAMHAIKKDAYNVKYVTKQTEKISIAVVLQEWFAFQYLIDPSEYVVDLALKKNEYNLQYVKNKTYDMCFNIVKKYGSCLSYVPREFMTPELILAAVNAYGCAISDVPTDLITRELCEVAIKRAPKAYKDIPEQFRTDDMAYSVINRCVSALRYVKNPSEQLLLHAVKKDPHSIVYIDKPSFNICLEAAKRNAEVIRILESDMQERVRGALASSKSICSSTFTSKCAIM